MGPNQYTGQEIFAWLQKNLSAPKSQKNKHAGWMFRNLEDIQEALKKIMPPGCYIKIKNKIKHKQGRFYVKSKAIFVAHDGFEENATAWAREGETKKGLDPSQLTGTAISYAGKYAMGSLFAVNDEKDMDTINDQKIKLTDKQINRLFVIAKKAGVENKEEILERFSIKSFDDLDKKKYDEICNRLLKEIDAREKKNNELEELRKLQENPF